MNGNCGSRKPISLKESHHLARDRLDAVLPARDDERRHLVADQHLVVSVIWFCTQFSRSTIL